MNKIIAGLREVLSGHPKARVTTYRRPIEGTPLSEDDLAAYIADHYGRCSLPSCVCLKPENRWLGRGCIHWVPTTARTWDELDAAQRGAR